MKSHAHLHLDVVMIVLVVLQFADLGAPIMVHRILGIVLCVLVIIHLWQHRKWFKALARGKWSRKRKVRTASALVAGTMIVGLISGFFVPNISSMVEMFANINAATLLHPLLSIVGSIGVAIHVAVQVRKQHGHGGQAHGQRAFSRQRGSKSIQNENDRHRNLRRIA